MQSCTLGVCGFRTGFSQISQIKENFGPVILHFQHPYLSFLGRHDKFDVQRISFLKGVYHFTGSCREIMTIYLVIWILVFQEFQGCKISLTRRRGRFYERMGKIHGENDFSS